MSVASKPVDPDHDVESHKALDIRPPGDAEQWV